MKHLVAGLFFTVVAVFGLYAQAPNLVSYQGLLTLTSGTPVANGSYDIKFELYNVPSGGSALWTETQSGVPVHSGTFTVSLGSVVVLPGIFNQPLYVQVTALTGPSVSSPTLFPRTLLTSVPYSLSLHLPFTGSSSQPASSPSLAIGNSGAGIGIIGSHDSTAGTDPGVMGKTNTTAGNAYAVEGVVTSSSPGSYSTAVRGINNGTSGSGIGVYGSQNGSGWGVYGYTPNGISVYGASPSGLGVYGTSNSNYGVYGASTSSVGTYGYSHLSAGTVGYSDSAWGLYGWSPYGYGILSDGKFAVTGASGDSSVQLPDNAIDSREILDEPGIAARYMNGFFTITALQQNLMVDSVTITVPSSGKIIVQSSGYCNVQGHVYGVADNMALNLSDITTDGIWQSGVSSFVVVDSMPNNFYYRSPFACTRIFNAPAAGAYKYYLYVWEYSGTLSASYVAYTTLLATYYPTAYGTTPVAVTPASAKTNGIAAANATPNQTTYQTVDQFNAEKTAVLQQNVQDLQNRLIKLESILQQSKNLNVTTQPTQHQ
jgi:hypothetical protein